VPVLLRDFTGPLVSGALLATEGVFALFVPTIVGRMSDRTRSGLGGRLPFLLVAAPMAALGLIAAPFANSLLLIALAIAVFYIAYFIYFTPYMALYPDLVDDELAGRAQGSVGAWREVGLGLALVGGGLLISLWRPLPFVFAAAVILVITAVFVWRVRGPVMAARSPVRTPSGGRTRGASRRLLRRRPELRAALAANALWETALSALRAFVVLFFIVGLDRSPAFTSAVLGGVVLAAFVAAPVAGVLADRFSHQRVIGISLWVYAIGLSLPLFTTGPWVIVALPFVAFAATTVMTLPFALIMSLMPRDGDNGAATGLFGLSRGVGLIAGPLLAGAAIAASGSTGLFADTEGYTALFGVGALALFASMPLLRRTRAAYD
jgi:Na+/melibiose symporter-like transporter